MKKPEVPIDSEEQFKVSKCFFFLRQSNRDVEQAQLSVFRIDKLTFLWLNERSGDPIACDSTANQNLLDLAGVELVWDGNQNAGSVARQIVASASATMFHSSRNRFGILKQLLASDLWTRSREMAGEMNIAKSEHQKESEEKEEETGCRFLSNRTIATVGDR